MVKSNEVTVQVEGLGFSKRDLRHHSPDGHRRSMGGWSP